LGAYSNKIKNFFISSVKKLKAVIISRLLSNSIYLFFCFAKNLNQIMVSFQAAILSGSLLTFKQLYRFGIGVDESKILVTERADAAINIWPLRFKLL